MPTFSKKPLAAVVVMLNLWPVSHVLANEFSLADDQITVDGIGSVTLASDGSLEHISADINDPVPANIPDIEFTLENNNTETGQYDVRMGLIIQQQGSNRRLESIMGVVRVTVDGSGDVTNIELLNTEPLSVNIREGSVTLNFTNDADIGVIQTAGPNVTISASAINNALVNANPDIARMVEALTLSGHYNYRVALQPVTGDFSVGTLVNDTFTPLARMQTQCAADSASSSASNFMLGEAASFSSAYAVHGVLSLGGATSPGAGFTPLTEDCAQTPPGEPEPEPDVDEANEKATADLDRAQDAIDSGDPDAAKEEVANAAGNIQTALDLLNQQRDDEGSANQAQLIALTNVFITLGQTIQAAIDLPGAPVFDEVDNITRQMQALMTLLLDKQNTLSVTEKTTIEDAIIQTLGANALQLTVDTDMTTTLRNKTVLANVLKNQAELGIQVSEEQADTQRSLNTRYWMGFDGETNSSANLNLFLFGPASNVPATLLGDTLGDYRVDTGPINPGVNNLNALTIPAEPGAVRDEDGLITLRTEDDRAFRYQFTGVAFVPEDALQNGIYNAPNGALYSVDDGVVVEFAAAPANLQTFTDAVTDMGYSAAFEGPGIVNIELDGGERLSAAFRFEDLIGADGDCSDITFEAPTSQPTSPDYVFTAQCNNGVSQTLVPVVLDQALYDTITHSGLMLQNSRDTGYLMVEGVGTFRPDFFVYPLTSEDQAFLEANAYLEGVALQAGDFNNDGVADYRLLSVRGKQTLWGL